MEIKSITKEMRDELRKPLDAKAVSPIATKPHLSSIKPIYVTERLNSVFGLGAWQIKVELVTPVSSEQKTSSKGRLYTEFTSLVKVIFTIPSYGVYYECIAGSTNEDEGDAVKGGISDCITKIGSWLEIGIEVYKGNGNKPQTEQLKKLPNITEDYFLSLPAEAKLDEKARATLKWISENPEIKIKEAAYNAFKTFWETKKAGYEKNNKLEVWETVNKSIGENK
jgi:hypothetical protein